MNNKRFRLISLFFMMTFLLTLSSCKPKKIEPSVKPVEEKIEYPATIISDFIQTSISDHAVLYPVNEEFLENFLRKAQEYEGEKIKANAELPAEWGVLCIEHIPEGRELWMLQSVDREWIYLVITSGMGTQRILDLVPVAVNLAVQEHDILETEVWSTRREPDGAFVVQKDYEWIKSVADTIAEAEAMIDPTAYQKKRSITDIYYINEMCRFDYVQKPDVAQYNAVIFYYDKENKPEEWDEYIPILQSYCEEKNIFFEEIYSGFSNVKIRDFMFNELAEVDITPHIGVSEAGMVMIKWDEEPKNVSFGSNERMKVEIKRYFKLLHQY